MRHLRLAYVLTTLAGPAACLILMAPTTPAQA
jgi:hypothetical protein